MIDDPTQPDPVVTELSIKRARRDDAETLLEEKGVFMLAVRSLRIRWFNELMTTTERSERDALTFKLQALLSIPDELAGFIRDHKFALDKAKRHG